MKLTGCIFLTTLLATIQCVVAAPAILERRALQISLRETHKNSKDWHFGLVIHAPNAVTGTAQTIYEHVRHATDKCMVFDDEGRRNTAADQLSITAALLPNDAADDDTLRTRVKAIISVVPAASRENIKSGDFNNCFDFALEAVRRLNVASYVSAADYQRFKAHHDRYAAAVKAKTDAGTMNLCKRGNVKGCTRRAKPGANGRTAAPKVAPKPKGKPAGKPAPKKRQ